MQAFGNIFGWIQLLLFVGLLFALTKPTGLYITQVLDVNGKTRLDFLLGPIERLVYRITGIEAHSEQSWQQYALSLLMFSFLGMLLTYAVLRLQHILPLNPQGFGPVGAPLAFNTAISFTTNTNWQNYAGESTLSYFSQMVGLVLHNFFSAAVGIAVAAALMRGISRQSVRTIGNFWTDMIRVTLYLLLPISIVYAFFLVSQGVIQNFKPYDVARIVEPVTIQEERKATDTSSAESNRKIEIQTIPQGPVASQVAIKMLGTNGGGFFNANAAHPFENPTPLSNFIQMLSIFLIPSGLTYALGRMVKNQRHGWTVWGTMLALFLAAFLVCWWAESAGNTRLHALGIDPSGGNMEGKEVRFGISQSSLFAVVTTDASCGAVNAMHDSFTPIGGLTLLFNMQLGELVFGGVGSGLYAMLVFVVLTIFLAGLMVGRTPEYLGKKIEAYDIKVSVLFILIATVSILGFSAWAVVSRWGLEGLNNAGPHGFSEILYAFTSCTANNGSAFAGLNANSVWFNTVQGIAMFLGRFFMIVPVLALAGSLAAKKRVAPSGGSFPVSGPVFGGLLAATVIIVGALTFLPALALGPVIEFFLMIGSNILY
jgi:K+-transporting ATPase ATPase A chain